MVEAPRVFFALGHLLGVRRLLGRPVSGLGPCAASHNCPAGGMRVQEPRWQGQGTDPQTAACDFAVVEVAGASRRRSVAAVHVLDTLRTHTGHKLDTR